LHQCLTYEITRFSESSAVIAMSVLHYLINMLRILSNSFTTVKTETTLKSRCEICTMLNNRSKRQSLRMSKSKDIIKLRYSRHNVWKIKRWSKISSNVSALKSKSRSKRIKRWNKTSNSVNVFKSRRRNRDRICSKIIHWHNVIIELMLMWMTTIFIKVKTDF